MRRVSYAVGSMARSLVIAAALLVGCGDNQLEELETIRDEVCACKTPACGEAALKKVRQDKIKSTRKTQRVASEMMNCMSKLADAERPSTDPDAETP
jgi:hypothetical protein